MWHSFICPEIAPAILVLYVNCFVVLVMTQSRKVYIHSPTSNQLASQYHMMAVSMQMHSVFSGVGIYSQTLLIPVRSICSTAAWRFVSNSSHRMGISSE
uniref:Putative secreted protein n=1 Tax=Rhipicephalus microplus TaxID=6941 RepID=A0A6G5A385_RHIMP